VKSPIAVAAQQSYGRTEDKPSSSLDDADTESSQHKPDGGDMTTDEVLQLSKLPDAHQPSDDEVPAIERDDWPAPPHPAAAYPELRVYTGL